MPLSDTSARVAKPREKSCELADGYGVYLKVAPNGSRYWRLKYRFDGREKLFATPQKEPRIMLPASEPPEFLRKLRSHRCDPMIGLALRLVILTRVRTIEVRGNFEFDDDTQK